ncbi:MAG: hypothetical protein WKF57_06740 [Nakamurella sp.]
MATERITIKLPPGFNPDRHQKALLVKVSEAHGDGWEIESIDPAAGVAFVTRQAAIIEVSAQAGAHSFDIRLARGTKPSDGDKIASKLADAHPGYVMSAFDPFLGKATLTKMDDATIRCRGAVAGVLGAKSWEVQCRLRKDGGFDLELTTKYVPSKHDEKLDEVAVAIVGRPGWYVITDPNTLTASIVPASPPTFPPAIPFPMKSLGARPHEIGFGRSLARNGDTPNPESVLNLAQSGHVLLGGMPGSGKTVTTSAIIADRLAAGDGLVVCNTSDKMVDHLWCKDFVRPGGWGCDSLAHTVTALAMVYAEGQKRAKMFASIGANNYLDLPAKHAVQPITVIVDEASALTTTDKVPSGVPKDNPIVLEIVNSNLMKVMIFSFISKIIAEMRFVGIRMIVSTQVANAATGLPPSLKDKIGHRVLCGTSATKAARAQIFRDETAVPHVPAHLQADEKASKGCGLAALEGQKPAVFKSYFATTDDYRTALLARGVTRTDQPAPTASQVAQFAPDLDVSGDDPAPRKTHGSPQREMQNTGLGNEWMGDPDGDGQVSGYAKANAARHALGGS